MAERFEPLPVTQVACVRSPVPGRPTISVEKLALFCNPASGSTFSSTAIAIINRLKFVVAKSNVFPHLEACMVRVERGIPHMSKVTMVHYNFVIPKNKCVRKKECVVGL
jgi:hypothetical protein